MRHFCALLVMLVFFAAFVFAEKPHGDGEIHDQVMIRLAGDQDVKGTGITVEVKEGVVTLTGRVESDKVRNKAEKLTKKVRGVKSVVNQLTVGPR